MVMQAKGLRQRAARLRSALDLVGKAYDDVTNKANAHVADVEALAKDIGDIKSDLEFAIGEVGNAGVVTDETGTDTAAEAHADVVDAQAAATQRPVPSMPIEQPATGRFVSSVLRRA